MKRAGFFLFSLFVFLNGYAESQSPVVVYVNDQKPWGWMEKDGQLKGASVDFARALQKELDIVMDIDIAPYHRLVKDFESGRIDFTMFLEDQRPDGAIPVAKLIDVDIIVVAKQGIRLDSVADLKDLKIGKMRGALYTDKFQNKDQPFECVEVHSYQQALELLNKGRLDAVLGTPLAIIYAAHDMGISPQLLGHSLSLDRKTSWIYTTKASKHQDKIPLVKAAVEKLIQKNILSDIASAYLEVEH